MKRKRYSVEQIAAAVRRHDLVVSLAEIESCDGKRRAIVASSN